jgi:hypothetical protein
MALPTPSIGGCRIALSYLPAASEYAAIAVVGVQPVRRRT